VVGRIRTNACGTATGRWPGVWYACMARPGGDRRWRDRTADIHWASGTWPKPL